MNTHESKKAAPAPPARARAQTARWFAVALSMSSAAAVAAPCNSVAYNPQFTEAASPGVDTRTFVDQLVLAMAPSNVKGYVATLTNARGEIVAEVEQGYARTACDPGGERTFTTATQTPWGSVSKLLTTATAIKVATKHGVDLDSPIVNFLPYRWRPQLHPRFAVGENGSGPVTLRMVLQHRAGFHHSSCDDRNIKTRLLDGDLAECADGNPPIVGTRSYSNMLGLFQIMLPYMYSQPPMHNYELLAVNDSNAQYDWYMQAVANGNYRHMVATELFAPIGITGSCNMAEISGPNPSGNYIRWYDNANDSNGALPHDQNHTCASGAWIMSSAHMRKLLFQLKHTENLLSREDYALMEGTGISSLGWGLAKWSIGDIYWHNGKWSGTRSGVRVLPGGFVATLVMNSSNFSEATGLFDQAFKDARIKSLTHTVAIAHAPGM